MKPPLMTATAPSAVGEPAPASTRRPARPGSVVVHILLWLYALLAVAPLLIMVINSFRTNIQMVQEPVGLPVPPNTEAYAKAWVQASFSTFFVNSLLVTTGAVLLSTVVSLLASYALARVRSRIFSVIEAVFLSGLMLPVYLAILPIFHLLDGLRLVDSRLGLTLVYAALGVPFSTFVLTQFFRQLPPELEEAGRIDGAGPLAMFLHVMLPLVRPAIATVVVFRFVPIWNDFFYPLIVLRSRARYTLPVGLTSFFGEYQTDQSTLFAGLVIATVPLIVLFLVATRQIVAGLTAGIGR